MVYVYIVRGMNLCLNILKLHIIFVSWCVCVFLGLCVDNVERS